MGIEPFILLGEMFSVPLLLLTLFLIATRKSARPYLLAVLLVPVLAGLGALGSGPLSNQLVRFATIFTLSWVVVGLIAFLTWLIVSAVTGKDGDSERTPNDRAA